MDSQISPQVLTAPPENGCKTTARLQWQFFAGQGGWSVDDKLCFLRC